jgi:hypothetical protein
MGVVLGRVFRDGPLGLVRWRSAGTTRCAGLATLMVGVARPRLTTGTGDHAASSEVSEAVGLERGMWR